MRGLLLITAAIMATIGTVEAKQLMQMVCTENHTVSTYSWNGSDLYWHAGDVKGIGRKALAFKLNTIGEVKVDAKYGPNKVTMSKGSRVTWFDFDLHRMAALKDISATHQINCH